MVVFTCNGCNESLRRNSVEAHFNHCGTCKSVACIDCLVDFRCVSRDHIYFASRTSFLSHNSCISESQKYDKQRHTEKTNSGVNKQNNWAEHVHTVLSKLKENSNGLPPWLLAGLQNFDNIPRKKAKFQV